MLQCINSLKLLRPLFNIPYSTERKVQLVSYDINLYGYQARSEEHLAREQAWLSSEKVWLLHRGGFTLATKCGPADPDTGKLRIRLATSGEELLVDEEDVEKVLLYITKIWCMCIIKIYYIKWTVMQQIKVQIKFFI